MPPREILRFASLSGRATRSEFAWIFLGAWSLGLFSLLIEFAWPETFQSAGVAFGSAVLSVCVLWFEITVSVRRLHDLGKTGWILPLFVVPVAGIVILVWLFGRPGTPEANRFGSRGDAPKPNV